MEYRQIITIPSSQKEVIHIISSCVKCNSDDIDIREYEDQYGYISTATCKNKACKNEVKVNASKVAVIDLWNEKNDIATLIAKKTKLIETTKAEIKQLKMLQRTRKASKK